MRIFKSIAVTLTVGFTCSCSQVPITGRNQLNIVPESEMVSMSATQYSAFLNESNVLPKSNAAVQQVTKVGNGIAAAVEQYFRDNGMSDESKNYVWTFNVVQDETVNAWCMPGGRVVFYTGILPVCDGEAGIAVVMGHEVAHAVAKHGNERMSQGILIQGAGMTLDVLSSEQPELTRSLLLQSFGIGSQLGTLAFSRNQELEADKLGLIFMAMAGYDPSEAVDFWQRMANQSQGSPPEFLSTHPSDQRRIDDLRAYLPEAMKYYKK